MFTIGSQSDYGLIILSSLIKRNDFVSLSRITSDTELPKRFLARIAGTLAKNGLLISHEGRDGGYKVTKRLKHMSLLEYLKIFEKNVEVCRCCEKTFHCHFKKICKHGDFFQNKLTNILSDNLKNIKLVEIFQ